MALLKIRCPECNAPLKSSTGFTVGEAVSCPKCETDFTVREPEEEQENGGPKNAAGKNKDAPATTKPRKGTDAEDDDDEDERPVRRSYKNSPLRYAVLGVLVVIMLVLAYMLYEKRKKEREADAADNSPGSSEPSTPGRPNPPPPGGPPPGGPPLIGIGGPKINPKVNPKTDSKPALTVEEAKKNLEGQWEAKLDGGEVITVEYKADGTFASTVEKEGQPTKKINGQWKLGRVERVPEVPQITELHMEWTVEGKPVVKEIALLRQDGKIGHPLLHREIEGVKAGSMFTKKK